MQKIWLFSKNIDLWLLGLPVWLCWFICFIVPGSMHTDQLPLWFWVFIIVGIDVSHVWSTIFRTYLDKTDFKNHKKILIYTPAICFFTLFAIAGISITLFWTVLAYVALYHFVKQQYGFMQLYRARYGRVDFKKKISDKFTIYTGMLYPVFYWHINKKRSFSWFADGDFFNLSELISQVELWDVPLLTLMNQTGNFLYFMLLAGWLIEEFFYIGKYQLRVPVGKLIWVLTTVCNWYLGIVYFNSDFAFSITNVVAHGVPYLVLLFFYVERKKILQTRSVSYGNIIGHIGFMLITILILAFGEEYLWDMFLYRDNEAFFESFLKYPLEALRSSFWQALAFAALSLPQVTHYVLDGFIWEKNDKNPYLGKVLSE